MRSSSTSMPPVPDSIRDPLDGRREGGFFHGYGACPRESGEPLPLSAASHGFCRRHPLAAKLGRSNIDASAGAMEAAARIVAQIRARRSKTRIPRIKSEDRLCCAPIQALPARSC